MNQPSQEPHRELHGEPTASPPVALEDLLLDKALCSPSEIEECSNAMDSANATLLDLLIARKYLTASQARRLGLVETAARGERILQIPGYTILSRLGSGAMSTVYKARQLSLDRLVAIKVLPGRLAENREFVERFQREGRAAARLNHSNIVAAYDVGEYGGVHYFVMEYIEGTSVFERLANGERYAEREALEIIIQVTRALVHAHQHGLMHRDVKPQNLMLTATGIAKLADMGLAREVQDTQAAQAEAGKAFGTPYYISPEQIRGAQNVDFRADVYSLGATLYHMITGEVPFNGSDPKQVMRRHLVKPLVPPRQLVPELSIGITEIVVVAMAKDRDRRYATMTDMLQDLEAVQRGYPPANARGRYDLSELALMGQINAEIRTPVPARKATRFEFTKIGRELILGLLLICSLVVGFSLFAHLHGWVILPGLPLVARPELRVAPKRRQVNVDELNAAEAESPPKAAPKSAPKPAEDPIVPNGQIPFGP